VHLSSDVVFDGERTGAYLEDDPPSPVSDYGRAKATAEQLVAELDPGALIVRTSLIYGGPTPSPHERLALDAADGHNQVAFFSDEFRCPIQVGDLAAALLEAAQTKHAGLLHIAGAETVSRYAFAALIAGAAGRDPASLRSARSADSPVRRPRNCALAIDRATQLLTTRLRGVREVLSQP
jgi:dTDP-4-dehydrorhamnose reductase